MLKSARVLVISSDSEDRGRLREALRSVVAKGSYANARALKPALDQLRMDEKYDFAFISTEFDGTVLLDFLKDAKSLPTKQRPVLMMCLKPDAQNSSLVANFYSHGAHGFVCEPYSPDELLAAMNVAVEKSVSGVEGKDSRIVEFLVNDAMRFLDQTAKRRSEGKRGGGLAGKELRRVSVSLKEAAAKIEHGLLENILIERFSKATTDKKGIVPDKVAKKIREVPHPGVELRSIMKQRQLSKEKLLSIVKITPEELEGLLAEQIAVSDDFARELSRALGKTSKYWMQLQHAHDKMTKEKEEAAKKAAL